MALITELISALVRPASRALDTKLAPTVPFITLLTQSPFCNSLVILKPFAVRSYVRVSRRDISQVRRCRSPSGVNVHELLANFQVTQVFICGSQLADIPHVNAVLVQYAAQRIASGDHIFMDPGFILGFIVQLILRNGFIFLSRLVDRLTGLRQQRTDFVLLKLDGFDDRGRTRVVNIGRQTATAKVRTVSDPSITRWGRGRLLNARATERAICCTYSLPR